MVIGATGSIGSVSARLLAMAFDEVVIAGRDHEEARAAARSILEDTPDAKVVATTDYDELLGDMDMIVTSTSGAGKKILTSPCQARLRDHRRGAPADLPCPKKWPSAPTCW